MSVGFHAVSRAQVTDIDIVMVIGCGMIGMGAIVRSALRGATVIAVDLDDEKLELAKRIGIPYHQFHDRKCTWMPDKDYGRTRSWCSHWSCRQSCNLCYGRQWSFDLLESGMQGMQNQKFLFKLNILSKKNLISADHVMHCPQISEQLSATWNKVLAQKWIDQQSSQARSSNTGHERMGGSSRKSIPYVLVEFD